MIEINRNPAPREVRVFGLLWLLFFGAVGGVLLWKPEALGGAAIFLGLAWLASMLFNPVDRVMQLAGLVMPALLGGAAGAVRSGVPALRAAGVAWAVGLVGAVLVWSLPGLGRRLYVGWMLAVLPAGFSVTHLVLAVVYYLVLTPIGLLMRAAGRDPMNRRFDRGAASYWIERSGKPEPARRFRQF